MHLVSKASSVISIKSHHLLSEGAELMLHSRAIGRFPFPTNEVMITSLSYSSALMLERIECSIPLVDNHINVHHATHAVC